MITQFGLQQRKQHGHFLYCDCEGNVRVHHMWANQHGSKDRIICQECYAYTDVEYTHKAMGQMVTYHGIMKNHPKRTVDKLECYFCGQVRAIEKLKSRQLTVQYSDRKDTVNVDCCEKCNANFEASKTLLDEIPF